MPKREDDESVDNSDEGPESVKEESDEEHD